MYHTSRTALAWFHMEPLTAQAMEQIGIIFRWIMQGGCGLDRIKLKYILVNVILSLIGLFIWRDNHFRAKYPS